MFNVLGVFDIRQHAEQTNCRIVSGSIPAFQVDTEHLRRGSARKMVTRLRTTESMYLQKHKLRRSFDFVSTEIRRQLQGFHR